MPRRNTRSDGYNTRAAKTYTDPWHNYCYLTKQMYEHTQPKCGDACYSGGKCYNPTRCCSPEYCELAAEMAANMPEIGDIKRFYGKHPGLLFMGEHGCRLPPQYRPICTVHNCRINAVATTGDPGWDSTYWRLRNKMDEALQRVLNKQEQEQWPKV